MAGTGIQKKSSYLQLQRFQVFLQPLQLPWLCKSHVASSGSIAASQEIHHHWQVSFMEARPSLKHVRSHTKIIIITKCIKLLGDGSKNPS